MNIIAFIPLLLAGTLLPSCSYRLTNKSLTPPAEIKSIAIESVYNTSEQVFPWRFFESNSSSLKVLDDLDLPLENADAILTLKLLAGDIRPTGTASIEAVSESPKSGSSNYYDPNAYPNLKKSGRWTIWENVSFTVKAEIHDLRTKKIIFSKNYPQSMNFHSQ